jgi:WD40 repeat protein
VNLHVDIPEGAEDRAWNVVRAAFAEREALPRPRPYARAALALAVALAIVAGALTGPGRAVLGDIREAVGEKNAAPALFALPAPGRLIVYSTDGPWIVDRDGSKRLFDRYDELSWSPHGRYVAATRREELFAIEPNGDVHWSLARTGRISVPTWGGTRDDTRIAYLGAGPNLRVVGGDGRGDRLLARNVARAKPAWLPAAGRHLLAFADRRGGIHLVDVDAPAALRHEPSGEIPEELEWVADGSALLALSPHSLRVLRPNRTLVRRIALPPGPHSLAVSPHGHRFALRRSFGPDRSELLVFDAAHPLKARRLFAATGTFTGVEWSPDGRRLLLAWPDADQWLFVGSGGKRQVRPVARVAEQFSQSGVFPELGGWCCAQ